MPFTDAPAAPTGPRVSVRSSAAVELSWVLHAALREDFRRGHHALEATYEANPDLLERAASFWDDGASSALGYLEFLVLAHHAQMLFASDADGWINTVSAHAESLPSQLPLRSESEGDRGLVLARLARLRRSARLRASYGSLLNDAWRAVRPTWQQAGRRATEVACATLRDRQARGEPLTELVRGGCDSSDVHRLVGELTDHDELAIVPAFFTHRGLLLDLPGLVLVGVRPEASDPSARARAEGLARRLKTLADPTRLAIVDQLSTAPRTVTDIARGFGIAQPTASNHVKLLRQAGLVTEVREGSRRLLEVDRAALGRLLEHLGAIAAPPGDDDPA